MTPVNSQLFALCRCPSDNTVSFHSTVSSRQRFSIQAFRFLNSSTAVYFHCLVFLCHTSSSDYRCRSGCQGNNIYRGKRAVTSSVDEPSKYYLLEMEVRRKEAGGKFYKVYIFFKFYRTNISLLSFSHSSLYFPS